MRGKDWHLQAVATTLGVLLLLSIAWALPPAMSASSSLAQPDQPISDVQQAPTPMLPPPGQALISPELPDIPPLPDLIVSQISVVPAIPSVGESALIQVTIKNQAEYDLPLANNFWTDLYVDPVDVPIRPNQGGVHAWGCAASWVPAGSSYTLATSYVFPQPGVSALYAQVDTKGHVHESNEENNVLGPVLVQVQNTSPEVLITAVYYDTYLSNEPEEAFRLMNVGTGAGDLTNWTVTDGEGTIALQDTLLTGASVWIARQAASFNEEFGFAPDYEYEADTDPAVPNLARTGTFELANTGDQVILKDDGAVIVDSVVYEGGDTTTAGWIGPPIYPYGGTSVGIERFAQQELDVEAFGLEGQILYRQLDQATGLPVPDTDTAADWAQATAIEDNGLDNINGKKVMYPGWDLER